MIRNTGLHSALHHLLLPALAALSPHMLYASDKTAPADMIGIECSTFRLEIATDGRNRSFIEKTTGKDYYDATSSSVFARVRIRDTWHDASRIRRAGDRLTVSFADCDAQATLQIKNRKQYATVKVAAVDGDPIEELRLFNMPLTLNGRPGESFAACLLALDIRTNVHDIPQPSSFLQASCYRKFGLEDAGVAMIGCPYTALRDVLKQVITESKELPKSTVGGPWAQDADINYGSYLMDLRGEVVESTVDDWIEHCRNLGVTQLDFHTGHSLRFGDYRPNPKLYPDGYDSVKRVIDKLHAAGIKAGLHTYSQFIAKDTPWVTPVPGPRLAKAHTLALAEDISSDAATIPVIESTADISPVTGFHVRNSATIQIDDELIVFEATAKDAPYAFEQCRRGALGTQVAPHKKGAEVHHLKQCYGLFVPDPETTLYSEVAARTAEAYNKCGFDMLYLDAIDGSDIFSGWPDAWHYSARFVYDLADRLERPALFEMSMFLHHFWCVRSRIGAWDVPARGAKPYIDMHTIVNESYNRCFLPTQLGWWGAFQWNPVQPERTFPEILDYLCCKSIGYNSGISLLVGFSQSDYERSENTRRMSAIVRRYEKLRRSGTVPEAIREKLRARGEEFTLVTQADGNWGFEPRQYMPHKVVHHDRRSQEWTVHNSFEAQPASIRIEALMSAAPYDGPGSKTIAGFDDVSAYTAEQSQPRTTCILSPDESHDQSGHTGGLLAAINEDAPQPASWSMVGRRFAPYLDLVNKGLGVWVHGDGKGEILNLQLQNPPEHVNAIRDNYITVDFDGWRYFELIEPESNRIFDYTWPYALRSEGWDTPGNRPTLMRTAYPTCHFWVKYDSIQWLNVYVNNVPKGETVECRLSPIKALPLVKGKIANPAITLNGQTIMFPVELESGSYLEYHPPHDCRVYDALGERTAQLRIEGPHPELKPTSNTIRFDCAESSSDNWRGRVTLIATGQPLKPSKE